ncbi:protein of unknown function [Blastococcus saxobsidens DD2]|uniref:Uncharacterized protein n=1 Tax=Blastococcus saxobsidens (strain DD2) TaxID=1146883 RepID=H6RKL7_BLASD|nr:protein of unknown function [Blastococcus saxobsidens DD2]
MSSSCTTGMTDLGQSKIVRGMEREPDAASDRLGVSNAWGSGQLSHPNRSVHSFDQHLPVRDLDRRPIGVVVRVVILVLTPH